MLTQLRRPIRLFFNTSDSLIDLDIETVGTLYQADGDRYHLLFTEPIVTESSLLFQPCDSSVCCTTPTPRLLWLEFSPFRVTLTMQGNGQFSYRHLFSPNVFGISRFWLQNDSYLTSEMQFRNFTHSLHVKGNPVPCYLLLEYELWAHQLKIGDYCLNIEIDD